MKSASVYKDRDITIYILHLISSLQKNWFQFFLRIGRTYIDFLNVCFNDKNNIKLKLLSFTIPFEFVQTTESASNSLLKTSDAF